MNLILLYYYTFTGSWSSDEYVTITKLTSTELVVKEIVNGKECVTTLSYTE